MMAVAEALDPGSPLSIVTGSRMRTSDDSASSSPRSSYEKSLVETRVGAPWRHTALLGRADECARLDGLIDAIRGGESQSLVLRGEPGIGKTALLEHLVESASGLTVLRAAGVESDMELVYASLHLLCGPLLE
jgi:hypothetical protein